MNNLRNLRKKMSITQKELATDIGCSVSAIGHYEAERRSPDIPTCHKIINAFSRRGVRISIEDIFPHPDGAEV